MTLFAQITVDRNNTNTQITQVTVDKKIAMTYDWGQVMRIEREAISFITIWSFGLLANLTIDAITSNLQFNLI